MAPTSHSLHMPLESEFCLPRSTEVVLKQATNKVLLVLKADFGHFMSFPSADEETVAQECV